MSLKSTKPAKEIHEDSSGKAKTMRPHSERSLRVRRLIASPRKAECISGAASSATFYRLCVKTTIFSTGSVTANFQKKALKIKTKINDYDLVLILMHSAPCCKNKKEIGRAHV